MNNQSCLGCRFFQRYGKEEKGKCRRYPPTTFASGHRAQPESNVTDWCGEFVALTADAVPEVKEKILPQSKRR